MAEVSKINLTDGSTGYIRDRDYCVCTTEASTANKTAALDGFSLVEGARVRVKFANSNTASNPTLAVGGTTAKPIMRDGTNAAGVTANTSWQAGAVVQLTYDGTNWVMSSESSEVYTDATSSQSGLMSGADKAKLDTLSVVKVSFASFNSLPRSFTGKSVITANHECIHAVLSNPSAQTGNWTVTTADGSVTVSGSISGSTALTLYLAVPTGTVS